MNLSMSCAILFGLCFTAQGLFAGGGERDRGFFREKKDAFLEHIKERAAQAEKKEEPKKREFKMDFTGMDLPTSPSQFTQVWHTPPLSQDLTGGCWSFSSTSFFESETFRLTGRKVKLSEMFTVYWEFVEKARQFVRERGESAFERGSQPNATLRIWRIYGAAPAEAYSGIKPGHDFFNDTKMMAEMKTYLASVKTSGAWNEEDVMTTIKSIMNTHIGAPPAKVKVDERELTPQEYLRDVLRLNPDDYVCFISLLEQPFYQKIEYPVTDNWWHGADYYNIPLEDFMRLARRAVREGYSICLVGDNSEPGFYPPLNVAVVPTFDISSEYIDDSARQLRFSNESTTDDHAIHLVGYMEKDGKDWYLIKDSATQARNGIAPGYMFYHEDFVRLKMLTIMVHKDAAGEVKMKN